MTSPAPLRPGQRAAKPAKAKPLRQSLGWRRRMWAVVCAGRGVTTAFVATPHSPGIPAAALFNLKRDAMDYAQMMNAGRIGVGYHYFAVRVTVAIVSVPFVAAGRAALRAGSRGGGRGKRR